MKLLDILKESKVDPEVEKTQRILVNRGFYLGNTGPNHDGVDGVLGPLTKTAYQEYYKKPYPTAEAQRLLNTKKIIIAEPPFPTPDNSVCVMFGGTNYATPSWMMQQVPKELLDSKTFAFAPYTSNIAEVEAELMGKQIKSVCGFSAGGLKVWPLAGKYEFVGLMDPSTTEYDLKYHINDRRVHMIYNNENWVDKLENVGKMQKKAKQIMGGNAMKVDMPHQKIPALFIKKFASHL